MSADDEVSEALADVARLQAEAEAIAGAAPTSGALVPLADANVDTTAIKASLAEMRATALKKASELRLAEKRLRDALDAKMRDAHDALAPLERQVKRLEEAIWTVNLYLGRDEEIVTLRDGAPAPEGTPIVCRSMVLSMAEECAIDPEGGGIDVRSIEAFDEWLLADPAHLDQVLPDARGVVVLIPTRAHRDYGDPWVTRRLNAANAESYWLIRNGDRLFRMQTEFDVGRRLVPARDEFTSLFYREERDWDTGSRRKVAIEPGTYEWARAEEAQGVRERHYMRVALILQGLIDRTTVFHPLPAPGISLLKQESYDAGHVQLLDEEDRALTTGREPFFAWLRRLNAELRPGMRIVGAFNSEAWRAERYERGGHSRLTPQNADSPDSYVLHTIEERRPDGGLVIRYDRGQIWDDRAFKYRPSKNRASAVVYPQDTFVIPIDLVTEAQMLDYLTARTERHAYLSSMPLLKAAIAVKRQELAAEEPFRLLLLGRLLAADDNLDPADASEAVFDLVQWWKFANKHHRPLVGAGEHEAKAARMIEAEYASRRKAVASDSPAMVARLRALPGVMLVARKRDGAYVALAPENRLIPEAAAPRNVWAHEWTARPRGATHERGWVLVHAASVARWRVLWSDERWAGWNTVTTAAAHLTDAEVYTLAADAIAAADALAEAEETPGRFRRNRSAKPGRTAVVTYREDKRLCKVYRLPEDPFTDHGHGGRVPEPYVHRLDAGWRRTAAGVTLLSTDWLTTETWAYLHYGREDPRPPWYGEAIVWSDDEVIAAADAAVERSQQQHREQEQRRRLVDSWAAPIDRAWRAAQEQVAYARFLEDYHDPDLWEGHRKTLTLPSRLPDDVDAHLDALIESALDAGLDLAGRTVADVAAELDVDEPTWAAFAAVADYPFTPPAEPDEDDDDEADE